MNSWKVIISPTAKKNIYRIPEPDKGRIKEAIRKLQDGLDGDVKPLHGRYEWRMRVGKWRVILNVNIQNRMVVVLFVETRGDVYKK